jgi:hypothetical protein
MIVLGIMFLALLPYAPASATPRALTTDTVETWLVADATADIVFGGSWSHNTGQSSYYDGTNHSTTSAGATAQISAIMDKFVIRYSSTCTATVYLDGSVNFILPISETITEYSIEVSNGFHNLMVETYSSCSSGTFTLDNFRVRQGSYSSEDGIQIYDDDDEIVSYTNATAGGGSYNYQITDHTCAAQNCQMSFVFTGISFKLFLTRKPSYGTLKVRVSNAIEATVDMDGSLTFGYEYSSATYPYGTYLVELIPDTDVSSEHPYVLDAIAINSTRRQSIRDGGMEEYPRSNYWNQLDYNRAWVRVNATQDPSSFWGWISNFWTCLVDQAHCANNQCGDGAQIVGRITNTWLQNGYATGISQEFYWDGGPMYTKFRTLPESDIRTPGVFDTYIIRPDGTRLELWDDTNWVGIQNWYVVRKSLGVQPVGMYRIVLNVYGDNRVWFDDVAVSDAPLGWSCGTAQDGNDLPIPTPVPTVTGTPPTPSPTPTPAVSCGKRWEYATTYTMWPSGRWSNPEYGLGSNNGGYTEGYNPGNYTSYALYFSDTVYIDNLKIWGVNVGAGQIYIYGYNGDTLVYAYNGLTDFNGTLLEFELRTFTRVIFDLPNYQTYRIDALGTYNDPCDDPNTPPTPTPYYPPTPTQAVTRTPTVSPTPGNLLTTSCSNFETGTSGWILDPANTILRSDGGPVGQTYIESRGMGQPAYHPYTITTAQPVYLTAWVTGDYVIGNYNQLSGETTIVAQGIKTGWEKINAVWYALPGENRLILRSSMDGIGWYDGVTLSSGSFAPDSVCSASTGTPLPSKTPTASPTWNPTLATRTPTPTRSPTPSRTPNPTWTPSSTPAVTQTPMPTAWNGGDHPPQQPEPAPDAQCLRPPNPWSVSWWIDYEVCRVLSWFSWGPQHTKMLKDAFDQDTGEWWDYEPFGTIKELTGTFTKAKSVISKYDWRTGGLTGMTNSPDPTMFDVAPDPYNGGQISLLPSGPVYAAGSYDYGPNRTLLNGGDPNVARAPLPTSYNRTCSAQFTTRVGNRLAAGMCFVFEILRQNKIMPWLQVVVDLSSVCVFILYFYRKFFDKAS